MSLDRVELPEGVEWLEDVAAMNAAEIEQNYGTKTKGLVRVPALWRTQGLAISLSGARALCQGDAYALSQAAQISKILETEWGAYNLIVRSSAVGETLLDRGRFISCENVRKNADELLNAIVDVCSIEANSSDRTILNCQMAVLVQPYICPSAKGHMANTKLVSKTRNQWQVDIEKADDEFRGIHFVSAVRFNSQRVSAAKAEEELGPVLRQSAISKGFQPLGAALAGLDSLVAIEWIIDAEGRIFVVQCDDEADPQNAIDPHSFELPDQSKTPAFEPPEPFEPYNPEDFSSYRKLAAIADFNIDGMEALPQVAWCFVSTLAPILNTTSSRAKLVAQLDAFAPSGVVIRSDILKAQGTTGMNLPRTDTSQGLEAVEWMMKTQMLLDPTNDPIFILHRFIPARSAAWSYCGPSDRYAVVNTLWGIPDGIQYYPHDAFEWDLTQDRIHRPHLPYKPQAIFPNPDGDWVAYNIVADRTRSQSLFAQDIRYIAEKTRDVAKHLGEPAQIMWFCDVAPGLGFNHPLPWYRERKASLADISDAAPELPTRVVRNLADIQRFSTESETERYKLELMPDADLLRSRDFLGPLIDFATNGNHIIILHGSPLAHAYHQLREAGLAVYPGTPIRRRRAIDKQDFGKLVRDKIPDVIRDNGDSVVTGRLPAFERPRQLLGKMVEEMQELQQAEGDAQLAELADIYELLGSYISNLGYDWDAVAATASQKRERRGGFEEGLVLLRTQRQEKSSEELFDITPSENSAALRQEASRALTQLSEIDGKGLVPMASMMGGTPLTLRIDGNQYTVQLVGSKIEITPLGLIGANETQSLFPELDEGGED